MCIEKSYDDDYISQEIVLMEALQLVEQLLQDRLVDQHAFCMEKKNHLGMLEAIADSHNLAQRSNLRESIRNAYYDIYRVDVALDLVREIISNLSQGSDSYD